jgi:hypothetical protein
LAARLEIGVSQYVAQPSLCFRPHDGRSY